MSKATKAEIATVKESVRSRYRSTASNVKVCMLLLESGAQTGGSECSPAPIVLDDPYLLISCLLPGHPLRRILPGHERLRCRVLHLYKVHEGMTLQETALRNDKTGKVYREWRNQTKTPNGCRSATLVGAASVINAIDLIKWRFCFNHCPVAIPAVRASSIGRINGYAKSSGDRKTVGSGSRHEPTSSTFKQCLRVFS
ncbi:hypothetical protein BKA66DRAFT_577816 [Pyrenochaeta sp. MPI-SDFR-AT-0127]|nr:hypothetical protein BKA66DRAFT_577816 [Pyrenochaeta sp. MPI-SDFR-AT-0127]